MARPWNYHFCYKSVLANIKSFSKTLRPKFRPDLSVRLKDNAKKTGPHKTEADSSDKVPSSDTKIMTRKLINERNETRSWIEYHLFFTEEEFIGICRKGINLRHYFVKSRKPY